MTAPSCCAGLRQTLLHGWQDSFPLAPSPFRLVAQRCGSTLQEVLQLSQRLHAQGSLMPPRPRWGASLQRCQQRWGLVLTPEQQARWWPQLASEPACVGWWTVEHSQGVLTHGPDVEHEPLAVPTLWLDLEGRNGTAGSALLQRLRDAGHHPLRACSPGPWDTHQACGCDPHAGPCQDTALAGALEAGLPLKAHPYDHLARQLGRTERQVLNTLKQWQTQGSLQGLALAAPESSAAHGGALACLAVPTPGPAGLARLRAQPGVHAVCSLQFNGHSTPHLWVEVVAPPDRALTLLQQALQPLGLADGTGWRQRVLGQRLRHRPALFPPAGSPSAPQAAR